MGKRVSRGGDASPGVPEGEDPLSEHAAPDTQRIELDGAGGATARLGGSGALGPGPDRHPRPRRRRQDAARKSQARLGSEPSALGGGAWNWDHALPRGGLAQDE